MTVSPDHALEAGSVVDMGGKELLVDAHVEQRHDRNIKLRGIHVIDQVNQDFFRPARTKIVNQK